MASYSYDEKPPLEHYLSDSGYGAPAGGVVGTYASRRSRDDMASVRSGPSAISYRTGMTGISYVSGAGNLEAPINKNSPEYQLDRLCKFIWDSETGKLCGRKLYQWLQLLTFYLVFYLCIAGLFAACLGVFTYAVVMDDFPVRTGKHSLLRFNPGLGIVPQPDHYTSLIAFRPRKRYTYSKYVDDLVAFTQWYELQGGQSLDASNEGTLNCVQNQGRTSYDKRKVCQFDLNVGGRCNIRDAFGYDDGHPCIALKLNRIYGWLPDPMPNATDVRVKCEGITDIDKDMIGPICYHDDNDFAIKNQCNRPYGEFKSYYFPYLKQINYQSPIVFVEFIRPKRHTLIMVECQAFAKNIKIDTMYREGSVRFELLVD